jgi:hypothetical protein
MLLAQFCGIGLVRIQPRITGCLIGVGKTHLRGFSYPYQPSVYLSLDQRLFGLLELLLRVACLALAASQVRIPLVGVRVG